MSIGPMEETPIITVAQMNQPYRQFRAELRRQTRVDLEAVSVWMQPHVVALAKGYAASGEEGSAFDYEAYILHQYARAVGLAR